METDLSKAASKHVIANILSKSIKNYIAFLKVRSLEWRVHHYFK